MGRRAPPIFTDLYTTKIGNLLVISGDQRGQGMPQPEINPLQPVTRELVIQKHHKV
jgi:hypothetical protein